MKTEIYDTLIDGRKYTFIVSPHDWYEDGIITNWIAKAKLGSGLLKVHGYGGDPESAALELVKVIEK